MWRQLCVVPLFVCACEGGEEREEHGGGASLEQIMEARGLSEQDVLAAASTYMPTGKKDDYIMIASGGQGANLIAIGVPSMRILKYVAVFSSEPWQGYGYQGYGEELLADAGQHGHDLDWGDAHHTNLSETKGDYDGEFIFINDKANARIAVVDLRDFMTKQIVKNPIVMSEHGASFVTPNTEYVIETSQYPAPLGGTYAPLSEYETTYRGAATFWKFDRKAGRIDPAQSWAIELPPYMQDLADAGKLVSDGWAFVNSFNTELAHGGEGNPPIESGASQNDMDYMHIIDWKKAERLIQEGQGREINGMRILPLDVAAREHVLTFVPEPKSPHGCDVTPDGTGIVVGGKLDTHTTVFEFSKIKDAIEKGQFATKDRYGVDVLDFQSVIRGQQEIGLGPLHTVFDDKGNAYTSVFLDSTIVRWNPAKPGEPIQALPVHYNVGHLTAPEGDTVSPDGGYVVAMNKMSLDRFARVGPLKPQNFQLLDVSGPEMRLVYDMPLPLGEPHYAQIIKADKLKPLEVYPSGTDPATMEVSPEAIVAGKERVERNGNNVQVWMTAIRSHFTPDVIEVNQGDHVVIHLTSLEQAPDETHGFTIGMHDVQVSLEPGKYERIEFDATSPGVFPMYCTEFCSALHLEMAGYFLVKPGGR
jgi:nitrous-oxide reductase